MEEKRGHLNKKNIYEKISNNKSTYKPTNDDGENIINTIKKIANTLSTPIFLQDGNYTVTWINNQTKNTFNLKENQIKHTPCYSLFFNKSSPCAFCPMNQSVQTKKTHSVQINLESGLSKIIASTPLFSNQQLIGVIQQIQPTENTQLNPDISEPSLLQTQQTIIDNAALGIIVLDHQLNHLTVNPAFCGMTGYEHTEVKKFGSNPIYWPEKFTKDIKTEINRLLQKSHLKMETYFQRKDRSIFPVSIVGSTFIDEETKEKRLILIIDDITKSKETERELKISQLLLLSLIQNLEKKVKERTHKIEQLLKQKNEFINQLGHDLKNPLGPLVNLTPVLLKHETDSRKKEMLTVIQRNTNHMKNLITKTIELAQLNSGDVKLHFENVNLTTICHNSISRNQHLLTKNNITIENNLADNLIVKADKMRIEELFDNILTNAAKYSPDGGTITINGSSTETTVSITIIDTGIGMDENQLQHVFDEFYKADPARHDFKSSGLGTSICKRIVEKHGGQIKIDSDGIGKGTTVTFTLQKKPLNPDQQKSINSQEKNRSHGGEK